MRTSICLALAGATGLSGCMSGMEITNPPVTASAVRTVPAEQVAGQNVMALRAYQTDASGKRSEVANATCTLRSPEFRAQVTTPQLVRYPQFIQAARFANRGKPGQLIVTCRAGSATGQTTVDAVPLNVNPTYSAPVTTYTSSGQPVTTTTSSLYSKQLSSSYPWHYGAIVTVDMQ